MAEREESVIDFDPKRFFKKFWLRLRSHWSGLILVYVIVLAIVYGFLWNLAEPLGISDIVNDMPPNFIRPYGFVHVIFVFLISAHVALLLELGFRRLAWLSFGVAYNVHMQSEGWKGQGWVFDGEVAGRPGKHKRIEAIKIRLGHDFPPDMSVKYQAHVQDEGWQPWVCEGDYAGTTGREKRMEAIRIELDNAPAGYSIVYRAFVAGEGEEGQWQPWVSDVEKAAGTVGEEKRIEAIRILMISPHRYGQFWKEAEEVA